MESITLSYDEAYNRYRLQALLKRTIVEGECIIWTGCLDSAGYGRSCYKGRQGITAHRAVWLASGREIPPGLELDHICFRRACVNVEHLRTVTHAENMANRQKPKDRCIKGHLKQLTRGNKLVCWVCRRDHLEAWKAKHPERWREITLRSQLKHSKRERRARARALAALKQAG